MIKRSFLLLLLAAVSGLLILPVGCDNTKSQSQIGRGTGRSFDNRRESSAALVNSIANKLNDMASMVVLELVPPVPILDDSTSADGREVLAVLDVNPRVEEGGYTYLSVPAGNANFRGLRVRPGDIVRYFVKYDQESAERGIEQVTYLELPVRRLDTENPQNALILEGGLSGPVEIPHRIEIWRFSDRRMNEIRLRLTRYVERRHPAVAWEPSPDESALKQLVDHSNQWLRNLREENVDWQLSPLLETLPTELREAEAISTRIQPEALRQGQFDLAEVRSLQEAIWHRDVAAWAKGNEYADLAVAQRLFDWTIRNIQLTDSNQSGIVHQPWQALMYGHGTAEHRAWVFAELCRQRQLDVVMLTVGDEHKWWLPALVSGEELYLFDTRLGLPIPGAGGEGVATLSEVTSNPDLLRDLDVDDEFTYPVEAEDLESVRAELVATPLQLSRRASQLQAALKGEHFAVLAANTHRLHEKLTDKEMQVALWSFPWESIRAERTMRLPERQQAAQRFLVFAQRPHLWKARVLHFQGTKAIPPDQQNDPLAQPRRGHLQATQLYQHRNIRPPDSVLWNLEPAKQIIYRAAKADASYWLGLLSFDLGKYEVAEDWLRRRTLEATPDGPWTSGAQYNLARTLEQLDRVEEAVELLRADQSPQRHGNLLRVRELAPTEGTEVSDEALASEEEREDEELSE